MTQRMPQKVTAGSWLRDKFFMGETIPEYLRGLVTPFNIVAGAILLVGIPLTVIRFTKGLASVTNLSDTNPWGLWIGFDVLCGVALAAGGFTIAAAVYLFGLKQYRPIVRAAILTGFLGYIFEVVAVLYDLGRPWRLPYPIFVSYGTTSMMFLVSWLVFMYVIVLFLEFCPSISEWLGWKNVRKWAVKLTLAVTILGVVLATLHQSALGALFLLAPGKLHPLWYSPFIPVFFFISAIVAGLSMVIFEGMLSHRIFSSQIDHHHPANFDSLTIGLGKAAAVGLFTYFCLKWIGVAYGNHWGLLNTPLGHWFLVEVFIFVLLPCLLYVWGVQKENAGIVRFTAILAVIGIIINRINVSIVAFNWNVADRYTPRWTEYVVTITIITVGLLTFRWIVNRMPVLYTHPDYKEEY